MNTPHAARWVFPEDYEWGDLIDNPDKLKTLANFESPYVQTAAAALNRGIDDEIIGAFFSDTTKTGSAGTTTTDWTTFVAANAGHKIANSSLGLTVAKLRLAIKALRTAEVDLDNEMIFCALTAKQVDDLFDETQVISLDYNTNAVLVDGKLKPFMGINFIHSERLLTASRSGHSRAWRSASGRTCAAGWLSVRTRASRPRSTPRSRAARLESRRRRSSRCSAPSKD
jgi:hypothetical protein